MFVGTTTLAAGVESIQGIFVPMLDTPATHTTGLVNVVVTVVSLVRHARDCRKRDPLVEPRPRASSGAGRDRFMSRSLR